jgi:hypothetical protein
VCLTTALTVQTLLDFNAVKATGQKYIPHLMTELSVVWTPTCMHSSCSSTPPTKQTPATLPIASSPAITTAVTSLRLWENLMVTLFADFWASPTCYQWQFTAQLSKVNRKQEHPTNPNLVITAGSSKAGSVRVHDIRKVGKTSTPVVEIDEHSKSINAAFVSGDGGFMVSVSLDNTVGTWSKFILPGSKPACEVD